MVGKWINYAKVSRLDLDFTDLGQYVLMDMYAYHKIKLFHIVYFVVLWHCLILNGIQIEFNMHR